MPDINGKNTSDVDITKIDSNYDKFENKLSNYLQNIEKGNDYYIYTIKLPSSVREINILISSNEKYMIAVKHRNNELELNKFDNLQTIAIWHKRNGLSTEKAWSKALEIKGDPYEIMARNNLIEMAKVLEERIKLIKENI